MLGFSAVFVAAFYVLAALDVTVLVAHRQAVDIAAGIVVIASRCRPWADRIPGDARSALPWRGGTRKGRGAAGRRCSGSASGPADLHRPDLGAILVVAANGGFGASLMLVYCLGLGVPFLLAAALCDAGTAPSEPSIDGCTWSDLVAGILLLAFGVLLVTGRITELSSISPASPSTSERPRGSGGWP